jgi:hypothetical protein
MLTRQPDRRDVEEDLARALVVLRVCQRLAETGEGELEAG